jgi:hypothetical protein
VPHEKRLETHLDNCSVQRSRGSRDWLEEYGMRRMSQRPYSPSLASSDCYLFRTVEEKLERGQVADEDQLFGPQATLRGIDRDELNRVLEAWLRLVQQVSKGNGNYFR